MSCLKPINCKQKTKMKNSEKRKAPEITLFFSNGSSLKIPPKEDAKRNKPGMGETTANSFKK